MLALANLSKLLNSNWRILLLNGPSPVWTRLLLQEKRAGEQVFIQV